MTFFPYMKIHYFHFINQTLSLKLKAHFTAISFQKAAVSHFYKDYCFFLMVFNKLFDSKQTVTNHKNKQIYKLLFW